MSIPILSADKHERAYSGLDAGAIFVKNGIPNYKKKADFVKPFLE
jgi:hypothetical protein